MFNWMFSHVKSGIALLVVLFLIGLFFNFMVLFKGNAPDGPAEECVEELINEELGIQIDLTPLSDERNP